MHRRLARELGVEVVEIGPGEYYATAHGEPIATLLGSCVAACIFDPFRGVGGMNHFMLPASRANGPVYADEVGRYAMYAMERLVNEVLRLGAERGALRAKVFGGASLLGSIPTAAQISEQNVLFAFEYLRSEGIPVVSSDIGGTGGRRLIFFPATGRVLLRRLKPKETEGLSRREKAAADASRKQLGNRVEWFD